ncbi:MAG TPA: DUF4129 domain-containing protein [Candidatus Limnocylindrales bacterium]|nr:DUF4129 domain-containing protein [Candidatus Limnocylindrales bacterium]
MTGSTTVMARARPRGGSVGAALDLVPLALAVVAEAAWITVVGGLIAEYTLQEPHLGIGALAAFVVAGILAVRLLAGPAGERWPSVALFLVAVAGMTGWLSDPVAAATLVSQGVVPALGVNVAGWVAGLAVLRGFAHARLPVSPATLGTLFALGVPCLALAALAGGMIADPHRARFLADATVAVVIFTGSVVLALAIARLTAVGAGSGFDWRRNPAWVALLVVLVLTTLAVAVPASSASPLIALVAGASVGPLLLVGLVLGFNRGTIRIVFLIVAGVILLIGLIRLIGGGPVAMDLGLGGGTSAEVAPPGPGAVAPAGLIVIVVVAMILVLILARLWVLRRPPSSSDVDEVRRIDEGDATSGGPPRWRFGRRRGAADPADAAAAYVRLIADIDRRPGVRRAAAETPAAHAARLRGAGRADLSLDLLAADYALARFGGVTLSGAEERRAIGRWRRLRRTLGMGGEARPPTT